MAEVLEFGTLPEQDSFTNGSESCSNHGVIQNEELYIVAPWEASRELRFLTLTEGSLFSFQYHGVCYK